MLRLSFLWVDKTREPWLRTGIEDYLARIQRYLPVQVREVRSARTTTKTDPREILQREGASLLRALPRQAFRIALDERGRMLDSTGLAAFLAGLEDRGIREVAVIVGGPWGLSPAILEEADERLSLSRLTFTHDLARLMLVEQIYRACTIRAGEPYHH